jgi:molybdopterin-binding protein
VRELGLKHQDSVVALIKPTDIQVVRSNDHLGRDATHIRLSGYVTEIQKGQARVCLTIAVGGWKLTSAMTHEALHELHLTKGEPVTAIVMSSDIELRRLRGLQQ